jgi:hypothetical protein
MLSKYFVFLLAPILQENSMIEILATGDAEFIATV